MHNLLLLLIHKLATEDNNTSNTNTEVAQWQALLTLPRLIRAFLGIQTTTARMDLKLLLPFTLRDLLLYLLLLIKQAVSLIPNQAWVFTYIIILQELPQLIWLKEKATTLLLNLNKWFKKHLQTNKLFRVNANRLIQLYTNNNMLMSTQ